MTGSVCVSIRGDVERPARLTLAELRSAMDAELTADFHCREGWSRLGERWRGVRLATLLELAGAAPGAGFPRLVGPSEWDCFLSVKSVDRIEVTRQPQRHRAEISGFALRTS